jgi:hypothetical protein
VNSPNLSSATTEHHPPAQTNYFFKIMRQLVVRSGHRIRIQLLRGPHLFSLVPHISCFVAGKCVACCPGRPRTAIRGETVFGFEPRGAEGSLGLICYTGEVKLRRSGRCSFEIRLQISLLTVMSGDEQRIMPEVSGTVGPCRNRARRHWNRTSSTRARNFLHLPIMQGRSWNSF